MYYNNYVSGVVLKLGGQTTKIMDKGSVEIFGPYGLEKKLKDVSNTINNLSTGVVTSYALYILIGLIFYISILYLGGNIYSYILMIIVFGFININKNIKSIK
jgi:NADH-ubiquinone oxidoreductase chain 5